METSVLTSFLPEIPPELNRTLYPFFTGKSTLYSPSYKTSSLIKYSNRILFRVFTYWIGTLLTLLLVSPKSNLFLFVTGLYSDSSTVPDLRQSGLFNTTPKKVGFGLPGSVPTQSPYDGTDLFSTMYVPSVHTAPLESMFRKRLQVHHLLPLYLSSSSSPLFSFVYLKVLWVVLLNRYVCWPPRTLTYSLLRNSYLGSKDCRFTLVIPR